MAEGMRERDERLATWFDLFTEAKQRVVAGGTPHYSTYAGRRRGGEESFEWRHGVGATLVRLHKYADVTAVK